MIVVPENRRLAGDILVARAAKARAKGQIVTVELVEAAPSSPSRSGASSRCSATTQTRHGDRGSRQQATTRSSSSRGQGADAQAARRGA